ncbi:hypothetical protein EYF80_040961 [Liparis tanakae]|uniref:Uncharacterized protein n=1 Tax=Liparis tanakae TaxID=230148 RepID=A0A4Z2G5H7_9TELE|nr:hypothetical protein EYF80_040961 [Liparis tanakae]
MKNCCRLGAAGRAWGAGLLWAWGAGLLWAWGVGPLWVWVRSCSGVPEETVTSSSLTTVGGGERAGRPSVAVRIVPAEEEQLDSASILTPFELRAARTGLMAGTEFRFGDAEPPPWPLFSTSSCIFSSSTSRCSCSSFFINSTICRSFSWSRRSFSSGTRKDEERGEDCDPAQTELARSVSEAPGSRWGAERSPGTGETGGGVGFMFSGAPCWAGRTTAGLPVAVRSMDTEERALGGEEQWRSWKGFRRSIRSVLVPDTGRPRSFSSSFSSATWTKTNRLAGKTPGLRLESELLGRVRAGVKEGGGGAVGNDTMMEVGRLPPPPPL